MRRFYAGLKPGAAAPYAERYPGGRNQVQKPKKPAPPPKLPKKPKRPRISRHYEDLVPQPVRRRCGSRR